MSPDLQRRNQQREQYRSRASWFLCSIQGIIGLVHLFPPIAYPSVNARTTRVVAFVNSVGGIWVYGLGVTALALALTLVIWKEYRSYAHLVCAGVTIAYDIQLWIGALGDRPFGPVVFPICFVLFIVGHLLLFFSYDGGD